tara:strand:- start:9026 stop:10264 length:1239 start_codon:yes stop_codon:yes gene_type:complete
MHPLLMAALIGGVTGGGTAYMSGRDPLRGALIGAGTGAATAGIGSIFSPAATAAKEAALRGSLLSQASGQVPAQAASMVTKQAAAEAAKKAAIANLGFKEQFKQALTGGFPADKLGAYKYGILPTVSGMGEYLLNPRAEDDPKKRFRPPLNMFYGRNPGRFMFGEFTDPEKIKEIYSDREDPYYFPEGAGYAGGGIASLRPHYQEGGDTSGQMGAMASRVSSYLAEQGIEPTMENVQDVIEKILEQQNRAYEPLTGIGGQLQRMTQQYASPMGEQMQDETGRPQMNMGGNPRRYYQEGGMGTPMSPMLPTGDLDMRPGGEPVGPGTGVSDDIPAMLSDGEFVMTAAAVEGAGGGDRGLGSERMMNMMRNFEQGGQPSQESQGLGSMEETTVTEMIGPEGMMMEEDTMMEGMI